jgi:hypothetical protein
MDVDDRFHSNLPAAAAGSSLVSVPATRTSPRRTVVSPKRSAKELRAKRISPKSPTPDATGKDHAPIKASKSLRNAASAKPLLPLTERRSQEEKMLHKAKKEAEAENWEVAPDGGSAGRGGRHFTVANVGNNGRIFLKYAICLGFHVESCELA